MDFTGTDDFVGDLMLNLCEMPRPSKTAVQCTMELMNGDLKDSIFKKKRMKGWWPFVLNTEESEPGTHIFDRQLDFLGRNLRFCRNFRQLF